MTSKVIQCHCRCCHGSKTISQHIRQLKQIPVATSMLSRPSCLTVLSAVSLKVKSCRKYIWRPPKSKVTIYQHTWQLETKFQCLQLETYHRKYEYSHWNFVSRCPVFWDSVTSGLGGRQTYFRYNSTFGDIVDNTIEQLDIENIAIAVLCAEIVLFPDLDRRHIQGGPKNPDCFFWKFVTGVLCWQRTSAPRAPL